MRSMAPKLLWGKRARIGRLILDALGNAGEQMPVTKPLIRHVSSLIAENSRRHIAPLSEGNLLNASVEQTRRRPKPSGAQVLLDDCKLIDHASLEVARLVAE